MWDSSNYLIRFVAEMDFSDPSYHLPHFYELFALWADEEDRPFWKKAALASRAYWIKACHPVTGLCAEYADMEGHPQKTDPSHFGGRHDWYYSDAYRTIFNIGLDAVWFGGLPGPGKKPTGCKNSSVKAFGTMTARSMRWMVRSFPFPRCIPSPLPPPTPLPVWLRMAPGRGNVCTGSGKRLCAQENGGIMTTVCTFSRFWP